jgi:calcium-dependent protein kinase
VGKLRRNNRYPPFLGKTDEQIKKKACAGVFQFDGEEWSHVSQEAKDLIRKMLLVDASKRLSAQECLQDAWIERYT